MANEFNKQIEIQIKHNKSHLCVKIVIIFSIIFLILFKEYFPFNYFEFLNLKIKSIVLDFKIKIMK
jgi:hypothetical protein